MTGKIPASVAVRHDSARRLQIGGAGMVTVLLLVALAGLIGEKAQQNAVAAGEIASEMAVPAASVGSAPLEELGVQPVSKDENEARKIKVPQAPPVIAVPDLEPDPQLARARKSGE